MKVKNSLPLVIALIIFVQVSFAQTKHALIFAIGNYPSTSGWPQISSANDVSLIKNALQGQNFSDIKVVQDKEATVAGISAALADLVDKSKPGDIDVIHFSSHGEQVEDLKRHKADGLEECIVSFNAQLPDPDKKYTQAYFESLLPGYYREDMFGAYVDKLREKLGSTGDLIVFLDFCHAGIGTRGSAKIRGGREALVSPGFDSLKPDSTDLATAFSNDPKKTGANLATYVVFAAARADELDYETVDENTQIGYGSLSYAISKVFLNLSKDKEGGITYRALFAQIQSVMNQNAANQHPVLAGNGADRLLFGGKVVTQKPYIEITRIDKDDLTINGGTVIGLDSGAKVAVYPSGTPDPKNAKLLDTGTVVSADLFTADVQLGKQVGIKQPADGWVFVTSPVFKSPPLRIDIAANKTRGSKAAVIFSAPEKLEIRRNLETIPGLTFNGPADIEIVRGAGMDSILIAQTGLLFDTIKSASADTALLKTKIARYAQYRFLKSINIKDPDALVDVSLIPLIRGSKGKIDSAKMKAMGENYAFKDGDNFELLITNKSLQDVYVNILDMQPDGKINPVIPNINRGIKAEDLKFSPGKPMPYLVGVSPPYGRETFKIFVSADPIDMEEIANTQGASSRGNLGVFERMVQKSFTIGTRGTTTEKVNLADANGSTYNLFFDIVKN